MTTITNKKIIFFFILPLSLVSRYFNKSTGVFFIFVKMGSALDMAAIPMLNARTYGYV